MGDVLQISGAPGHHLQSCHPEWYPEPFEEVAAQDYSPPVPQMPSYAEKPTQQNSSWRALETIEQVLASLMTEESIDQDVAIMTGS